MRKALFFLLQGAECSQSFTWSFFNSKSGKCLWLNSWYLFPFPTISSHHTTGWEGGALQPQPLRHQRGMHSAGPGRLLLLHQRLHRQPLHRVQAGVHRQLRVSQHQGLHQQQVRGPVSGGVRCACVLLCVQSCADVSLRCWLYGGCFCVL